jgi:hypothetical protein
VKPAEHDIEIYRGDTFELFFRVRTRTWDGTAWVPGAYRDLTGFTPTAQMRSSADAADPAALTFVCTLANQTTTPGGVLVRATPALTAGLAIMAGVYDVQLSDGTDKFTYLKGAVAVDPDVTRP